MSRERSTSIILLGAIVLLAVVAMAMGSGSEAGRADLVGSEQLLADRPGELALGAGDEPTSPTGSPTAVGESPTAPLPVVPNGPDGEEAAGMAEQADPEAGEANPSLLRRLEAGAPAVPQSLSIPSLGVDSAIVPVGLEDDGTMQIPGASEAGWYLPGRLPGAATGSAVIAAHVDYEGSPGVFLELRKIEVGSEIAVTDAEGTVHRFNVSERYQVGKDELPVQELFRSGGDPILTLVTCGGAFDPGDRSYSDNIVVRAVPQIS